MPATIISASVFGYECKTVRIEVDILNGQPGISIVGLGDTSVQESKERIRSAIKNSGTEYPRRKKTINLAPANLRKYGPSFDLPIALGLLVKSKQLPGTALEKTGVLGELSLGGELRPIPGIIALVAYLVEKGYTTVIVPFDNAQEAAVVKGATIIAPKTLAHLIGHLRGTNKIPPVQYKPQPYINTVPESIWHFEDIRGNEEAKRVLTIAAAGGHNVLLNGPPGTGKTLLARAIPSILPQLSLKAAIETTKIYSIAGKHQNTNGLITCPPFRSIHHTASSAALAGGGTIPRPGEISLAHNGVLFLDELLEFPRSSLEVLRQPLEERQIHIARANSSATFPANVMLVAATNPCECGFAGDPMHVCLCTPTQLQRYQKRLSGPLLDRIDLTVHVPRLSFETLDTENPIAPITSDTLRANIIKARMHQSRRYQSTDIHTNSEMRQIHISHYCKLDSKSKALLKSAFNQKNLSGRGYHRILKVARTIADLDERSSIMQSHLAEAIRYHPTPIANDEESP